MFLDKGKKWLRPFASQCIRPNRTGKFLQNLHKNWCLKKKQLHQPLDQVVNRQFFLTIKKQLFNSCCSEYRIFESAPVFGSTDMQ
jgi:hypothetical protein